MSTFGKAIEINLFGESHGSAIGLTINNFPAGVEIDFSLIRTFLYNRRPKSNLSTPRKEQDEFEIISGYFNGYTTGSPITFIIRNNDTRSRDYKQNIMRPSHADFTATKKYNHFNDYRGGGHFSGRLTAPLMILGALSSQLLAQKDIIIGSHIASIKDCVDTKFKDLDITKEILETLNSSQFPVLDIEQTKVFESIILKAKEAKDSVGGTIETMIHGLDPGYGNPFFDSIESIISHLIFSIPAVKGIEFGEGFDITKLFGSDANDSFYINNGQVRTKTNNSGGIQGGISNGMPITFKTAIKPTASIGKTQNTVDIKEMKEVKLDLVGRHDPCIVHRVIHVINALTSYATLEIIIRNEGISWIK